MRPIFQRARRRFAEVMRRFLSRCVKIAPESLNAVMEDCQRLGIPTPINATDWCDECRWTTMLQEPRTRVRFRRRKA